MHAPVPDGRRQRWFAILEANTGRFLVALLVVTAALAVPFLTMAPTRSASTEPSGDVFTARDLVADRFASSVRGIGFVVEDPDGDLLRAAPLLELLTAQDRLRNHPEIGPTLFRYFEPAAERDVVGVMSLADLIDDELRGAGVGGLAAATDAEVKQAGARVIERYGERSALVGLSARSTQGADGSWTVPAITPTVLADDTVLGFGATAIALGGDTEPEAYDRRVQEVLRSAEGLDVYGIAIAVNLTAEEQGAVAGPFIGFTILAVLALVGATFRSYWILTVVSSAFLVLIVWLKGITNLIGLEDDLVLSLIVPVAMISFGVDFAFHAIGRYREEQAQGLPPGRAFVAGSAAVLGALTLALASDSVAFLANLTSGIESIEQFGVGAAIGLASAFVLLGLAAPLAVSRIEGSVPPPTPGRRSAVFRLAAGAGAGGMAMGSVLLMVFLVPWLGLILAALTLVATLVVPYLVSRRRFARNTAGSAVLSGSAVGSAPSAASVAPAPGPVAAGIGRVVTGLARRPLLVLATATAVTAGAATLAVQVPATFDVEDYFSSDTDFVVGLDLLDEHVGDRGGEPAQLYIEGDLADPAVLATVDQRLDAIRALDTPSLARDGSGAVLIDGGVFAVFDAAWSSPVMAGIVAERTGVALTDDNGDGIPDTRGQVEALLATASEIGVPLDGSRLLATPDDVTTAVDLNPGPDGRAPATVFEMGLVNSRAQESVTATADALTPIAEALAADLDGSFVQITGSPFVREASLAATNRALQTSLPLAVVLCLIVASLFLRSVRYGLAATAPIIMVVAWLYAVMYLAGFAINLVTATIAAVSIGVGVDFAIHFVARYREELQRLGARRDALRISGEGTGLALVASALSSIVGFAILALAPMPLFAAYGLLTALMILMALVATLAVLPSLLMVITRDSVLPSAVTGGTATATGGNGAAGDHPTGQSADRATEPVGAGNPR